MENTYWTKPDFWISCILSAGSLIASILAFVAANKAKKAAREAAKTVKIQTVTIDLSEIILHLDKLNMEIDFSTARDLLNETRNKVRRLLAPYNNEIEYKDKIAIIFKTLDDTKTSLLQVKPEDPSIQIIRNSVYYSIENNISLLSGHLAELMGLFEYRTIKT